MLLPHLLDGKLGSIFVIAYVPDSTPLAPRKVVVIAPAFAEEMNRSRRTLNLLGAELCRHNIALVIPDLGGTGDSGGNFSGARWACWRDDLIRVVRWTHQRFEPTTVSLLGIRLGAALAAACTPDVDQGELLFWQPTDGKRTLKEFLRIWEVANVQSANKRTAAEALAANGQLEVGGYALSVDLAHDLDQVSLALPWREEIPVHWFEFGASLSRGSQRVVEKLQGNGTTIVAHCVESPRFWRIQEITIAEELVRETITTLTACHHG